MATDKVQLSGVRIAPSLSDRLHYLHEHHCGISKVKSGKISYSLFIEGLLNECAHNEEKLMNALKRMNLEDDSDFE